MTIALLSASLFDIAALTSTSLTSATSVLTWRFGGMMTGTLLGGVVYRSAK